MSMVNRIDGVLDKLDSLIETQEFYEAILNAVPYGMFTVDKRFIIDHVNDPLCNYLGYTREELIGQPLTFLMPPELRKQHQAYEKQFKKNPVARSGNHGSNPVIMTKAGKRRNIEVSFTPFTLHGKGKVLVVIRDIEDIKQSLGIK
jgi:PAS domain S-box-containing protein